VEAVGAMGDPEGVDCISAERMNQCGDLGGIDLSVAGADRVNAVSGQGVAEQRAQFLQGARGVAGHVDALGVVLPVRAAIFPGIRQGAAPLIEVSSLIGVGADDGLDGEVVLKAFQGRDEERLRVSQPDQPDMGDTLGLIVASGQFGSQVVMVLQPATGEHLAVAGLEGRQVIPAWLLGVLGQGGHAGEIQPLGRTAQLIA